MAYLHNFLTVKSSSNFKLVPLAFILVLSSCGLFTSDEADSVSFESGVDCEFSEPSGVDVSCGWLEVPQDWNNQANGKTLKLHSAVLTTSSTPDVEPVVYLDGGPGGDSLGPLSLSYPTQWADIVAERPLVLFSQRGAKFSEVDLVCEEDQELTIETLDDVLSDEELEAKQLQAFSECSERLQDEGADFSIYSSENSAHDVNALRESLGYETWNLLGVSYGSRLAQSVMRLHPEGVRSVLLDAVMPTVPEQSVSLVPQSAARAFKQLFQSCEADSLCSEEFPNLEQRFYALVDELNREPIEFKATNPLTQETFDVVWTGDQMVEGTFNALYNAELFSALPQMVQDLENGDYRVPASITGLNLVNSEFIAVGMNLSVLCHDVVRFIDEDEYLEGQSGVAAIDAVFGGDAQDFQSEIEFCDLFGEDEASSEDIELVESDIPTLLMSGEYDPITPPRFAEVAAEKFENKYFVKFDHLGHSSLGEDCPNQIAFEFWNDPSKAPDTLCVNDMAKPSWVPGSFEGLTYEQVSFEDLEDPEAQLLYSDGFSVEVPSEWRSNQGEFSRNDTNIARPATIVPLAVPAVPVELLMAQYSFAFGIEDLADLPKVEFGGRSWDHSSGETSSGLNFGVYSHVEGDVSFILIYLVSQQDTEAFRADVAPNVLGSMSLG